MSQLFSGKDKCISALETCRRHVPTLWRFERLPYSLLTINHNFQGFFAVKRRAVFILVAKWKALVRGWRRECVVGGMETRFQWRKAHSRTARCEAFHVAPRLFFMFLFLIPFTIRQQCIIYPQEGSTEPLFMCNHWPKKTKGRMLCVRPLCLIYFLLDYFAGRTLIFSFA